MKVGTQSVHNDLEQIVEKIEENHQEAMQARTVEANAIESGNISSGAMLDDRPIGVYHFDYRVLDSNDFNMASNTTTATNGCGLFMKANTNSKYGILSFTNWAGDVYTGIRQDGVYRGVYKHLTTKNTIVDANGFIKTA